MLAPPRLLELSDGSPTLGLPGSLVMPAALWSALRFTPEPFAEICAANREAVLELAADGSLIPMTPTGSETGASNSALNALLWQAIRRSGLPLKLFDSYTGFRLPDHAVFSPDAALVGPRTLAESHSGRTPRLRPPLPRSAGGTGQPR